MADDESVSRMIPMKSISVAHGGVGYTDFGRYRANLASDDETFDAATTIY